MAQLVKHLSSAHGPGVRGFSPALASLISGESDSPSAGEGCLPALRRSVSVLAWLERRVAVMVSAPRPGGKGASPKQTFFFGSSVSWTGMSCSFPFSPQSDRSSSCGCAVRAVLCPYDSRPLPESVLQGGC